MSAVGDTFVVHMDREALHDVPLELYDVTVSITAFDADRHIEWTILSTFLNPQIGHLYGYTLEPLRRWHIRHLVLRLVTDRPGVAGTSDLPDLVRELPAGDPRNPRPYRRSRHATPDSPAGIAR